jgi:nicotinamide-nucleotide amidase
MQELLRLAEKISARLKEREETIAVAESAAGGLISAAFLSVDGASAYFRGGGVIYTGYARSAFLDVYRLRPPIERPCTESYATLMADSVRTRLEATWGLGETGTAGPAHNRYGDNAGHSCIAVSGLGFSRAITLETGLADRIANMRAFAGHSIQLLGEALEVRPAVRKGPRYMIRP